MFYMNVAYFCCFLLINPHYCLSGKQLNQILLNHKPSKLGGTYKSRGSVLPANTWPAARPDINRSAAFAIIMIQTRTPILFTFVFFAFCFVIVLGQTTSPETSKFQSFCCVFTSFLTVDMVKQWLCLYLLNYLLG